MRYLENYLERIKRKGNLTLADAISKTVSDVVPQYISNFSFREHVVSLLVGDVQSGKTSHSDTFINICAHYAKWGKCMQFSNSSKYEDGSTYRVC